MVVPFCCNRKINSDGLLADRCFDAPHVEAGIDPFHNQPMVFVSLRTIMIFSNYGGCWLVHVLTMAHNNPPTKVGHWLVKLLTVEILVSHSHNQWS